MDDELAALMELGIRCIALHVKSAAEVLGSAALRCRDVCLVLCGSAKLVGGGIISAENQYCVVNTA